jgi:putative flippase GtrA
MLKLTVKYALFAALTAAVNIGSQMVFLKIYGGPYSLYLAVAMGTLSGLVVKYVLDKFFIFYDPAKNIRENSYKFLLYSIMGVFTTLIFWAFEFGFDYLFHFEEAKFIGASIGLAIGYLTKYQLDKKFVFINYAPIENQGK